MKFVLKRVFLNSVVSLKLEQTRIRRVTLLMWKGLTLRFLKRWQSTVSAPNRPSLVSLKMLFSLDPQTVSAFDVLLCWRYLHWIILCFLISCFDFAPFHIRILIESCHEQYLRMIIYIENKMHADIMIKKISGISGSPPGSYTQNIPQKYSMPNPASPPTLPPQLLQVILNTETPLQVILNFFFTIHLV